MTETTGYQFTHLAPAEAGLGRIFARPKAIAAGCVIIIAGLGWFYLALLIAAPAGSWLAMMQALCRTLPEGAWSVSAAAVTASMWGAMTLAMMLPSAAPMILTYAEIAETAARKGERIVSPLVIAAGYASVWLVFSLLATVMQIVLTRAALLDTSFTSASGILAGAIFIGCRRLSILRAQTCLSHALPESVPVLFHQLGHDARRRIPPRDKAGALLSWVLLGDDAGDVCGRGNECGLDGRACCGDDN